MNLSSATRKIIIIAAVCTAAAVAVCAAFFSMHPAAADSSVVLEFPADVSASKSFLTALNKSAVSGMTGASPNSQYAYFRFSAAQSAKISAEFEKNGDAALALTVKKIPQDNAVKNPAGEKPFMFGLLYKDDFSSMGRLHSSIGKRPLVKADLQNFTDSETFTAAFCFPRYTKETEKHLPAGFFIYSTVPASLQSAQIVRASVGWNRTALFFSFPSAGGMISRAFDSDNCKAAADVFPEKNTTTSLLPSIIIELIKDAGASGQHKITLSCGKENFTVRFAKGQQTVQLPAASLSEPFSEIKITSNTDVVNSVLMVAQDKKLLPDKNGNVLYPYVCDPGLIIDWNKNSWRTTDYELFEWQTLPGVLFFDTRDYDVQSEFFRRLAFFVEKAGTRGLLLTDGQLKDLHGYNAHDYNADALAAFFAAAEKKKFKLDDKEYLLKEILLANGIIQRSSGGLLTAGKGAAISISQESPGWLRSKFIAHEGWHGIFFTDADFRTTVSAVYDTVDPTAMSFLRAFWAARKLNYDNRDQYLMHNEFMAYMMQQSLSSTAKYFMQAADEDEVKKTVPVLARYIQTTKAAAFEKAAAVLNDYAYSRWGLSAGKVWLVTR